MSDMKKFDQAIPEICGMDRWTKPIPISPPGNHDQVGIIIYVCVVAYIMHCTVILKCTNVVHVQPITV